MMNEMQDLKSEMKKVIKETTNLASQLQNQDSE